MKAAEYLEEIRHRLTPERQECIKSLIEQTRITRSRPKPMPVPSADKGYGRYASPFCKEAIYFVLSTFLIDLDTTEFLSPASIVLIILLSKASVPLNVQTS